MKKWIKIAAMVLFMFTFTAVGAGVMPATQVAAATDENIITVEDIGDADLYAVLVSITGSSDSILYKDKAANITSFDMGWNQVTNESAKNIKSFANLAKYCPNITYVTDQYLSSDAYDSFVAELMKLEKLDSVLCNTTINQSQFDSLMTCKGITSLYVDVRGDADISKISSLSGLTFLSMDVYDHEAGKTLTGAESLAGLTALSQARFYGSSEDIMALVGNCSTSITELDFSVNNNQLTGTLPLARFTNITRLTLDYCGMSDISGLSGMTGLTYLSIRGNNIEDSATLATLTGLEQLYMSQNKITDMSFVQKLTELQNLNINENQITAVPDLSMLDKLRYLDLENNQIADVSGVKGMDMLGHLDLEENKITDLTVIKELPELYELNIRKNELTGLAGLNQFTNLRNIYADYNQITDLSDLAGLKSLRYLSADYNQITDISPLAGLTDVYTLYLNNNQIADITPLSTMTSLDYLHMGYNQIESITALKGLESLHEIWFNNNQISQIDDLVNFASTWLWYADFANNQIAELPDLKGLTNLTGIHSEYSGLSSQEYYRLCLYNNQLDASDFTGKLADGDYNKDLYIYLNSSMKYDSDGSSYYENLTDAMLAFILDETTTIRTADAKVSIGSELLDYLIEKDIDFTIQFVYDNEYLLAQEDVRVDVSEISADATTLVIEREEFQAGQTTDAIDQAYGTYGTPEFYLTMNKKESTDAVSYNSLYIYKHKKAVAEEWYNKYRLNADGTFKYMGSYNESSLNYNYSSNYAQDKEVTYFYVKLENDNLIGLVTEKNENGYWNYKSYYKILNDNIILGSLEKNQYSWSMSSNFYTTVKEFAISASTFAKIKETNTYVYFYYKDAWTLDSDAYMSEAMVRPYTLITEDVNIVMPEVTIENSNAAVDAVYGKYGTPSIYVTVKNENKDVDGIEYSYGRNQINSANQDTSYNIYKYNDNNTFTFKYSVESAPYIPSNGYGEFTYFFVEEEKDNLIGLRRNSYGSLTTSYYKALDEVVLTGILSDTNSYKNIYTTVKEFTIPASLVTKMKESYCNMDFYYKEDWTSEGDNISAYIGTYTIPTAESYSDIVVSMPEVTQGITTPEIDKAFGAYGKVSAYVDVKFSKEPNAAVQYSVPYTLPETATSYNRYEFNPENAGFVYTQANVSGSNKTTVAKDLTYFFVPKEDDKLIGIDPDNNYAYYKQMNSDIIQSMIDAIGETSYYIYTDQKQIELSDTLVSVLKSKEIFLSINRYNTETHRNESYVNIVGRSLEDGKVTIVMPDVSVSDTNQAGAAAFGCDIKATYVETSQAGATESEAIRYYVTPGFGDMTGTESQYLNSYKEYDGYMIYNGESWVNSYSQIYLDTNKKQIKAFVTKENDTYSKLYYNMYSSNTYAGYNRSESGFFDALVKYSTYGIATTADKISISKETVEYLKDNSQYKSFAFVETRDSEAKVTYAASVSGSNLEQREISEAFTIERPQVTVSTSNSEFAQYVNPGVSVVYVTTDKLLDYVSYNYMPEAKLVSDLQGMGSYLRSYRIVNGRITMLSSYIYTGYLSTYGLSLNSGVVAYVSSGTSLSTGSDAQYNTPTDGDYDTPSDGDYNTPTDGDYNTPSDEPTTEAPTPAETKPVETTTAEVTTQTPTQTTAAATEATTQATEATTQATTAATEATTQATTAATQAATTVEATTEAPTQGTPSATNAVTSEKGMNSGATTVRSSKIVAVDQAAGVVADKLENSVLTTVETYSKEAAPVLPSNIFSKMKTSQKNVSVGVTDANNRLQYSWTFDYSQITDPDMDIDLSMSFDTDRAADIEKITGRTDVVYLSFAHHGALPGPATMKTYVGTKYKNGDIVYLYYFNEEKNQVETVGNGHGLVVNEGYVEFTITHCSVYLFSEEAPEVVNAVVVTDNSDNNNGNNSNNSVNVNPVVTVNDTNTTAGSGLMVKTGDTSDRAMYFAALLISFAGIVLVAVLSNKKKRAN